MLQQMLIVIGGMKDTAKLGKLQAAVLQRICDVTDTDPVTHLQLLAGHLAENLTHEEADYYAQRRFRSMEPEPGESSRMFHARLRRERDAFAKQYPNWRPDRSDTAPEAWRPGGQSGLTADPLRSWGDAT